MKLASSLVLFALLVGCELSKQDQQKSISISHIDELINQLVVPKDDIDNLKHKKINSK
tara:strand:+ start:458 stop:631 length:174 start_codon:yes stop_codon:yes gene_type:complete